MNTEANWEHVLAHDARFDGVFVYAVRSTGVYCRPSCPSRRPRRQQVEFFEAPAAAEQAGYRACRRCLPQVEGRKSPVAELVARACRILDQAEAPMGLAELGQQAKSSPFHLQRAFKRVLGISPRQYWDAKRLGRFKRELLTRGDVTEALYEAGYGSSSRLYEQAPQQLGMTPATYGAGGRDAHIYYTAVRCRLGRLLLAATDRGLCQVGMGDSVAFLEDALHSEFPLADIERDDHRLADWAQLVVKHIEGSRTHVDLPLDIQATAFQRRVWEMLRRIPRGETRSYGEIARQIGDPHAARAVAGACASNPVALVIPCHRVVRGDGESGGYRWGAKRKAALLEAEHPAASS